MEQLRTSNSAPSAISSTRLQIVVVFHQKHDHSSRPPGRRRKGLPPGSKIGPVLARTRGGLAEALPKDLQRGGGLSAAPADFEFGSFRLDAGKGVLWHEEALVPLTPKALAVLQVLVEARGDVVPKADLMARVWPDTIVEDANLSVTVSALRRGLGRHAGDPAWVETVPRRGYRFAGPLRAPEAEPPLVLAVLPFRGIGPDAQDHLGLGIADALIGALTGVENVTVRPTGAVAHFAHQHVAPLEAAEALGADAVLDGTVHRQGHRVRISVQLIPRRAGLQAWAEQYATEPVKTTKKAIACADPQEVKPQITAANTVIMQISVENASPDFSRQVNNIPPIDTERANTRVLVTNGETTVIGGIYVSREQTSQDRTPGLHRVPLSAGSSSGTRFPTRAASC